MTSHSNVHALLAERRGMSIKAYMQATPYEVREHAGRRQDRTGPLCMHKDLCLRFHTDRIDRSQKISLGRSMIWHQKTSLGTKKSLSLLVQVHT